MDGLRSLILGGYIRKIFAVVHDLHRGPVRQGRRQAVRRGDRGLDACFRAIRMDEHRYSAGGWVSYGDFYLDGRFAARIHRDYLGGIRVLGGLDLRDGQDGGGSALLGRLDGGGGQLDLCLRFAAGADGDGSGGVDGGFIGPADRLFFVQCRTTAKSLCVSAIGAVKFEAPAETVRLETCKRKSNVVKLYAIIRFPFLFQKQDARLCGLFGREGWLRVPESAGDSRL